ncbi:2-oxoacid:acceptor oxidoreductase, alpha subunit [Longilinea arvoryzae]|uniref:2-oxoacid:acceptor oxidoreductase, alpha subunit n=1 Tax=Longilinea arvoryzae TaxID=360412 RepID=A0A0S7BAQ2_9CHLR|nr:2-oxoacid:acceptor oxidoreductase subunit alpha [Longilinea arvoryzae]GAP14574.1 2-oxoacid:acceptor oxidoreductase, alpha subunit [Longilinea arvoryzae]
MSEESPSLGIGAVSNRKSIVNDFCITISTINGSGSATANNLLLRALFRMGIPVSGKNIFPSNIQGLPTWYSIRLSKDGYLARVEKDDVVIAMNPASFTRELEYLVPGGVLFYADDIKAEITRTDIFTYAMPVKKLIKDADVAPNLRDYIANMVYVGVVGQMLGIEMDELYNALDFHFKGKKKAIDSNFVVIKAAADWAAANLEKKDAYRVERMSGKTENCIMADGNTSAALGALFGGLQFSGWYPITPATSLAESLNEYLPTLRKDPKTGKYTCMIVQAEDELAAIGMVIGAGWAGLRSMTSTSGPGLSLMSEYLGLAYYAEVPCVVWDVQRVGPSTGLPTRTQQGDLTQVYFNGHGDTQFVMLIPSSVNECFEFGWRALDIAERLQTPVIVMSDLDLGMNQWMTRKFEYPDRPMDRGKILWEEDIEALVKENKPWGRYLDIDGDGIPYRTVAGNKNPRSSYFTRGTGHDEYGKYSEEPEVWERVLDRIALKIKNSPQYLPEPEIDRQDGSEIGIIVIGSAEPAVVEARDQMKAKGTKSDYMRIRSIPFNEDVEKFLKDHKRIYVVELNRDGQTRQLLMINYPQYANKLVKVAHTDGLPLTAKWVRETIEAHEEKVA